MNPLTLAENSSAPAWVAAALASATAIGVGILETVRYFQKTKAEQRHEVRISNAQTRQAQAERIAVLEGRYDTALSTIAELREELGALREQVAQLRTVEAKNEELMQLTQNLRSELTETKAENASLRVANRTLSDQITAMGGTPHYPLTKPATLEPPPQQ